MDDDNLTTFDPGFFAFCVALVVVWLPTFPAVRNFDTWQLLINTLHHDPHLPARRGAAELAAP